MPGVCVHLRNLRMSGLEMDGPPEGGTTNPPAAGRMGEVRGSRFEWRRRTGEERRGEDIEDEDEDDDEDE